jgi:uncharacterized SAM-binding protein YcdF (DUF218 family)
MKEMNNKKRHRLLFIIVALFVIGIVGYFSYEGILTRLGEFIVYHEKARPSDAVIVLNTGLEYHPRLIEAADLYRKGLVKRVVINGNRKDDVLRGLEEKGFTRCCPWYEEPLRILKMLGVPRERVLYISVEDAYDTVTEASAVGKELIRHGYGRIIITTSKYHSRRAHYIWTRMYKDKFAVFTVAAKADPFDPDGWWKEGRQIRWVMAEYGAWIYYWWKKFKED